MASEKIIVFTVSAGLPDALGRKQMDEIYSSILHGITVQVNGISYNKNNLEQIPVLKETENYMRDYIGDEKGKIKEIVFNKINH